MLFDRARDAVMAELDGFAVHMESKLDRLTPYMKDLVEQYLTSGGGSTGSWMVDDPT